MADGCLEYSLPFSWSPGQTPDRCDRGQIWRAWQESAFIDTTLNFTWLHLIESRQEGRFASRLRSSIPELYRCPRCGHRYPHVCGTEWDRQSYLDMASGRNAEKQISHVKQVCKCYFLPPEDACSHNDEPGRTHRRVWRKSTPYPSLGTNGSRHDLTTRGTSLTPPY